MPSRYRRWPSHRAALLRQNTPEEENRRRIARLRAVDRREQALMDNLDALRDRAAALKTELLGA